MKVVVWAKVDDGYPYELRVISDETHNEILKGQTEEMVESEDFSDWLEQHYSMYEVWAMSADDKAEAENGWKEYCAEYIVKSDEWQRFGVEV